MEKILLENNNEFDKEAILVKFARLVAIGHVANSPYTVLGESFSSSDHVILCEIELMDE